MRRTGIPAALIAMGLLATACSAGGSESAGQGDGTLTYWAAPMGQSVQQDKKVLGTQLARFEQRTGVKVKLEIVPWPDLLNRILGAATSGQGPDVVDLGNTWSASLQATGAFLPFDKATLEKVGGRKKFLATSLASCGAAGKPPASIPLLGMAYGLVYNKKMFADAGITRPPTTWGEFTADARRLTKPGQTGVALEGASYTENAHFAFILGRQHGAKIFKGDKPDFASPQMVKAVKSYVGLMATNRVADTSNAEYAGDDKLIKDLAANKSAMIMVQNPTEKAFANFGLTPKQFGVAPIPVLHPLPPGGQRVSSHVGGVNLAVFKDTHDKEAALKFADFMTSPKVQKEVNANYGSLPVIRDRSAAPKTPIMATLHRVLATSAQPMPMVPQESQFETLIGTAIKELFAQAASGQLLTDQMVRDKLSAANQQMQSGG